LKGETFWLLAQHRRRADYVPNIEANHCVKLRTWSHSGWRTVTAPSWRGPSGAHR
jgi:hypothetical protein